MRDKPVLRLDDGGMVARGLGLLARAQSMELEAARPMSTADRAALAARMADLIVEIRAFRRRLEDS